MKNAQTSAASAETMIDINDGFVYSTGKRYAGGSKHSQGSGSKAKIFLIAGIAVGVVALGAAGFYIFNSFSSSAPDKEALAENAFVFENKTVISGIDVTGKNLKQSKLLLGLNKKKFINPVSFSVNVNGNDTELKETDFDYTYNIDEVIEQARQDVLNGVRPSGDEGLTYQVKALVTEESINRNTSAICKANDTDPIDAYVTAFYPYAENRFDIADATDGCKVDSEDLKSRFVAAFDNGDNFCQIDAKVDTAPAEFGADALRAGLVKLSSYETYSTNTANGTTNMKVSLASCNGSIIEPGATWSFNGCTGDSNLTSNGYKSASVISNGKIEQGIGGGICQSSSTIYNAAIRANMSIKERYNHKWASSYVPTGLDATIDYPGLDLKLTNPTKHQMFLECKVVGSTLYASFWGVKTGDYDEIHTHNEISSQGGKTYSVRAWRVYLKGGKEIDREELPSSSYDSDHGVVFIQADNDTKAVDTNVDGVDDPSSSTESVTDAPSQSSEPSYVEPVYTDPEPVHTDPPYTPDPEPTPEPQPEPDPGDSGGEGE